MTQLSESQLATIRDHPIGDALDSFRAEFMSAPPRTSLRGGIDHFQQLAAQPTRKNLVLKFIHTLSGHPAALNIPSHDGKDLLVSDLSLLYARLSTNKTDVKHTAQLVKDVVAGENDPTILTAVYNLILQTQPAAPAFALPTAPASATLPITPQRTPSTASSVEQTPTVSKTGSLISTTETRSEVASGAPTKTGTKVFMAIGALYGEDHSFMHDLESFFWLLFWICTHWNGSDQEISGTEYDKWNSKDTRELAREKSGLMLNGIEFDNEVDRNFTAYCRPLVPCIQQLRTVVFPNGKSWDRREKEKQRLYFEIRSVLDKAKTDLSTPS